MFEMSQEDDSEWIVEYIITVNDEDYGTMRLFDLNQL